jgi:hypothetical protein
MATTININGAQNVNIFVDDDIQPIGFTESEDLSEEDITLRNFIEDLDYKIRHDKDFSKRFFAEVKGARNKGSKKHHKRSDAQGEEPEE